jgi:hypothetical protein
MTEILELFERDGDASYGEEANHGNGKTPD